MPLDLHGRGFRQGQGPRADRRRGGDIQLNMDRRLNLADAGPADSGPADADPAAAPGGGPQPEQGEHS
ncbi:hypothetical protein GCM10009727_13220 [Actinomadura napierensis]|uniref:Uncharacterized protein n=1 Tax=Actinomadura napierensis TaxID=267854 RepID=A0ABN2YCX3_9ACTN